MASSSTWKVVYKKKDGQLTVADDRRFLFWTPADKPGASPAVTIPVADITNLQQTPVTSKNIALKVLVNEASHVFTFTNKDTGRKEQEAVTDLLRDLMAAHKDAVAALLAPAAAAKTSPAQHGGQSGSLAIAQASSSSKVVDEGWYDDSKLKSDFQLQRSLLGANKPLNDRFTQSLRDKPDTVTIPQFTAQFWSTRLHHLRAHAIEKAQKEGEYNVLPAIKHTSVLGEDGEYRKVLNVTKEQIALIFKQYPVVRKAFNENCPRPIANASEFWGRFFGSRLLKKLKGERIDRNDPQDSLLDRYIDMHEAAAAATHSENNPRIPHFIDLEGNEQNSKFKVNREGWEMSAARHDQPILHVLNNLSEKMLSHVRGKAGQAHAPIGMDEDTFEQLRLRDLAMDDADNRVVLNVREQQRHQGGQDEDEWSADARLYAKQDPAKVLSSLRSDLQPAHLGSDERGSLRLDGAIGFHSDDDSDNEDEINTMHPTNGSASRQNQLKTPTSRINSHAALTTASTSMFTSIAHRRAQTSGGADPTALNGLSQSTFDTLTITHNTTIEFLHYFWTLFLSGDSTKAVELQSLVSTLDRSLDRINAVGDQAEKERAEKVKDMKQQVAEYQRRTGKKRKIDESGAGGGRAVVDAVVGPTVEALGVAAETYRRAFEVQSAAAAAAVG
ncbi:hypothetical protein LTR36_002450 [Oleoguttula mirabilis]|uniref:BSD domain-containing protein n=1 Tax=Oleoguttula mirabilis TaxID=1507867 RepID=A0AAV9JKV8_9PEZI|nr:hypothetical protein LTR36_002450 [Oleoguttula mirabilis]